MGIGDRLKEERERLGLNQTDFAALAGASKNTQYNYEKGERSPDANYLAAAASQGVDVLYVLTGERMTQASGNLTVHETQLVERYRTMSPEGQATINSVSEALASFNK
ncbi:helix-turn-helix transcriptional regulator [Pseudomonas asiatica]|uniref:helix-turn-helix domain-containing protein n=1 Tax=Pseudomonas asiatica TaxID=2219225 RepID=UPI0025A2A13E|nr:helix-turn-helix transcriptional regulator [Pseudomonas asiatica]WJM56222.1 helix-turn-helix transcriptional regulator [Pseudomonas asiatica]